MIPGESWQEERATYFFMIVGTSCAHGGRALKIAISSKCSRLPGLKAASQSA